MDKEDKIKKAINVCIGHGVDFFFFSCSIGDGCLKISNLMFGFEYLITSETVHFDDDADYFICFYEKNEDGGLYIYPAIGLLDSTSYFGYSALSASDCNDIYGHANEETLAPRFIENILYDFTSSKGSVVIIDFCKLDRDVRISGTSDNELSFVNKMIRKDVTSLSELDDIFSFLIGEVSNDIRRATQSFYSHFDLSQKDYCDMAGDGVCLIDEAAISGIKNQLIFDVLYQMFLSESRNMSLMDYCREIPYMPPWHSADKIKDGINGLDASRRMIRRQMERELSILNNPELREEISALGFNPESVLSLLDYDENNPNRIFKMPKPFWDNLLYNANPRFVSNKQFNRNVQNNKNYSYQRFIEDYNACDVVVETFIDKANSGDAKDYFLNAMEYFHFEKYKRLDFIYKLAERMERLNISDVSSLSFLTSRVVFDVIRPFVDDDEKFLFSEDKKHYLPLLMMEEEWQKANLRDADSYSSYCERQSPKSLNVSVLFYEIHVIRAKAYEIFNYRFRFKSDNYDALKRFLCERYNILGYHESKKEWYLPQKPTAKPPKTEIARTKQVPSLWAPEKKEAETPPKEESVKKNRKINKLKTRNAQAINEALFWKSDNRTPVPWTNPASLEKPS